MKKLLNSIKEGFKDYAEALATLDTDSSEFQIMRLANPRVAEFMYSLSMCAKADAARDDSRLHLTAAQRAAKNTNG